MIAGLLMLAAAGLAALGVWQLERRVWKHALIARVDARVHAPPVAAPGPSQWPRITAASDEYRRVQLTGTFLHRDRTLVQASTRLGAGLWVITPMQRADGTIVLVNRGFVPAAPGPAEGCCCTTHRRPRLRQRPRVRQRRPADGSCGFLLGSDGSRCRWLGLRCGLGDGLDDLHVLVRLFGSDRLLGLNGSDDGGGGDKGLGCRRCGRRA